MFLRAPDGRSSMWELPDFKGGLTADIGRLDALEDL
jgi:hypothetical protein